MCLLDFAAIVRTALNSPHAILSAFSSPLLLIAISGGVEGPSKLERFLLLLRKACF